MVSIFKKKIHFLFIFPYYFLPRSYWFFYVFLFVCLFVVFFFVRVALIFFFFFFFIFIELKKKFLTPFLIMDKWSTVFL